MSLFAVVALFLGVMATGCSEGDNTPADSSSSHKLKLTIGFQNGSPKGYDCPLPARLVVGLQTPTGSWDE